MEIIKDYRMTRVTLSVSASSFVANMRVKQNALNLAHEYPLATRYEYPLATRSVKESFYVDDGLTGADDVQTVIKLQKQLNDLSAHGGFQLHNWNSNNLEVLQRLSPDSRNVQDLHLVSDVTESTKTLGVEWKMSSDQFNLKV